MSNRQINLATRQSISSYLYLHHCFSLPHSPSPHSFPFLFSSSFYFIFSDKKNAGILERAAKHKIASKYIPVGGRNREAYDEEVSSSLKKAGVQLVLMVSQSVSQSVHQPVN